MNYFVSELYISELLLFKNSAENFGWLEVNCPFCAMERLFLKWLFRSNIVNYFQTLSDECLLYWEDQTHYIMFHPDNKNQQSSRPNLSVFKMLLSVKVEKLWIDLKIYISRLSRKRGICKKISQFSKERENQSRLVK